MSSSTGNHHVRNNHLLPGLLAVLLMGLFGWLTLAKPAEAATIERCGTIPNETWTAGNVYVLTCSVIVDSGVTLTIQAGTVVKFQGSSLTVNGTLDTQGTGANRVVFTSH
jgi:hypothetical protein